MSEIDPSSVAADYHQFVPFTARMMAAIRAIESERTDRLFADPFAALLAGEQAFASVAAQLSAQDRAYVAVRTHFLDLINVSSLDYAPYRGYFQFGCDQPAELLSASGWQAVVMEPGDEGANFGRYPRSLEPKADPSVQRAFLVTTVKL
jgi:hypothetical protein